MTKPAGKPFAPKRNTPWSIAWLTLVSVVTLMSASASAQVSVTATAGDPGPTAYTTLKGAFDAINLGTHQGVIDISVTGDTDEGSSTAALNASGSGSASYTSVLISPSGGAPRTISGATTAGNPLIDLNGADNVTVDGLNTGGNALTISNTTVSATSGTSTIRFQADATDNLITNTSILGSSTMSTTTNGGNIWFGAGAVTTGSDNNTISNCSIGPAGTNLPSKAISGNGTTTTTAQYNSGIVITNNNIYDFFNGAAQSNGIYLAGGNSGWTISNNRFYQTATRTQTTGAVHSAIQLASSTGNDGHTVSGNVIGYSSAAGTGTYTLVGVSSSSKFLPIYVSSAATTTASSFQGNTVTAINLSGVVGGTGTTGAFVGISIASGVANIGNLTGNTIGSLTTPGAISITSNNTSAMEVYGIYYFPSQAANVSNNVVAGITAVNGGAGSLVFYGIRAFTTSSATNTMLNNAVGSTDAPITNTSASTSSRTIGLYCQSGACVVTGNAIGDLSMSAPNVGTGSSASVIGLWIDDSSATIGNNVAQNTVRSLSNNDPAAAVWVTGLQYNGATTGTHVVQRNFIHSLSAPSTSATATVNGINVQGGLTTYQNNMIALGGSMTANSPQINGFNETVAGTDGFYFNSVYIGGSGVAAGTASSFAFQSAITINTRSYRDNVFFNARSNGAATAKHYAIRVGGTAPNPAGLTSDNNILLANGNGGVTGLFNLVDQATLAAWRTATGQDGSSFALDPQFLAPTAATPNLHINPTATSVIEGNGFAIAAVSDDFDGQARAGLTPTDIGADAGDFLGADLSPPAISHTPLGNTSSTANRTLTATVADLTGVATGGLSPRIYYRRGAGPYFSQGCSLAGGTVNNGTWDCVVNNADMGGVATGDVIFYFVIAQDVLGNVGSNPGGAVAVDVNNLTSPPPVPNTYAIVPAISGSFDVGAGQTYSSLTNAAGLFEAINASSLTGDVVINITSDLTSELGTNALNQWAEDGAGGYTLTIKPSGGAWAVSGDSTTASTRALIRLNGADRVTIDGSASGGSDRSLTISNADTSTGSAVILVSSGAGGAQNDALKNLVVIGSGNTQTFLGIGFGGAAVASLGADNDNNRIENCDIRRVQFGIASQGASVANKDTGTVIARNLLNSTGADSIAKGAIVVSFEDGIQITQNTIGGIVSATANDVFGISLGGLVGWTNATVSGGSEVSNATVTGNAIGTVQQTNTYSAAGIIVTPTATGTNLIANNFISGVLANGTAGDFGAGIFVIDSGADSSTDIYANSIAMTGTLTGASQPQYALAVNGSDPQLDVRDNVFLDTQSTGTTNNGYAVGLGYATFTQITSDFNDLFVTSTGNFRVGRTGGLGTTTGTDQLTLVDWQAATGQDAGSISTDPLFASTTDLHLQPASPLVAAGTPLAAITVDFDNQPRSASAPDIGADEVVPPPADLSITKTHAGTPGPGESVVYTVTAANAGPRAAPGTAIADSFPSVLTCSFTAVGAGGATGFTTSGAGNINDTAVDLPAGGSVTYTATCSIPPSATGILSNTATVTASAGVTEINPVNNTATDAYLLTPTADLSVTLADSPDPVTGLGTVAYTVGVSNAGPAAATSVQVVQSITSAPSTGVGFQGASGTGWSCSAGATSVTCTLASLAAGASAPTLTIQWDVGPEGGTVLAQAVVSAAEADPQAANNTASASTTVNGVPYADLGIVKNDGGVTVLWNRPITYTLTVSNAGPGAVTGATVADSFPASVASITWTCVASVGSSCPASGSGTINASVDLAVSGTVTFTATGRVVYGTVGPITNTATVTSPIYDTNTANNSSTINTPVDGDLIFEDGFQTPVGAWPEATEPGAALVPDPDGDGDVDLVLRFETEATGIGCGVTGVKLEGLALAGPIEGRDSVNTVGRGCTASGG